MKSSSILTDVTTYISAQEYLMSQCMRRNYEDPFALQAYSELTQTIFLYEHIYVPHPVHLYDCSKENFGKEPKLLIELFDRGIIKPLNLKSSISSRVEEDEKNLLDWLQKDGAEQLNNCLTTMQKGEKNIFQ